MAFADDLQSFLESRLTAFDPTLDLSPGSPAQVKIIQPTIDRLGEDPFTTDITLFIRDRMLQEYPQLMADNGGQLEDILTKPLQLLLEPFKREIQRVEQNQSVQNLDLLSEDEADALGANWYADRNPGNTVTGPVRLYFAAPTTQRVTPDKVLTTPGGLSFFPIQSYLISSTQMVFNREGTLYYLDIQVQAEKPGDVYNVKKGDINSIQDVPGVVKVANLSDFSEGRPKPTNDEYLGTLDQALTERSLVTKRGALTRTNNLFDAVRAMQVVGAGELGMDRDILKGTGEGFLHLVGAGTVYGDWIFLSVTFKDDGPADDITVQAGDTVRFQPSPPDPSLTVYTATVKSVFQCAGPPERYLLILEAPFPGLVAPVPVTGVFLLLKPGYITISDVPGGMAASQQVPDDTVHLGGHVDVFVRPTSDSQQQGTIENLSDEEPLLALTTFAVVAPNLITSVPPVDFAVRGVKAEHLIILETGAGFAGTYHVLEVTPSGMRVDVIFPASSVDPIRGRVMRTLRVGLNEPRWLKLPFGDVPAIDLQTVVGSDLFRFLSLTPQDYGVGAGDIIRVLDGPDAGDFTILEMDPLDEGGHPQPGAKVDRAATSTGANLRYEIFTKYIGLQFPLVRLKQLEVLDSTGQSTGISVPYGDAVDVRPVIGFEGATRVISVYEKQLVVFPDASTLNTGSPFLPEAFSTVADDHDTRYTQKLETADGRVQTLAFNAGNEITEAEVNIPPFVWNGRRNKLLVLCNKPDPNFTSLAPGSHRTSDVAEGRVGDALAIIDGPNQGKYLIRDLRVFELWGKSAGTVGHHKIAMVEIDPALPCDPIATAMALIDDFGGTAITDIDLLDMLAWSSDFDNAAAFYRAILLDRLITALGTVGLVFTAGEMAALMDNLCRSGYMVGPSAHGDLRLYFLDPVSIEMGFGDEPTYFEVITNRDRRYRLDPDTNPAQLVPESETATAPTEWSRDGIVNPTIGPPTSSFASLTRAFPKSGVRTGDLLQYHPAINDFKARGVQKSSWLGLTTAGTNIIKLLIPAATLHKTDLAPGQLLFIDSGPDMGPCYITEVIYDGLRAGDPDPADIRVRVDRVLTHSTVATPTHLSFHLLTTRGGTSKVYADLGDEAILDDAVIGAYLSLYGVAGTGATSAWDAGNDAPYLGSFAVTLGPTVEADGSAFNGLTYVTLDKTAFPAAGDPAPSGNIQAFFAIHMAPDSAPLDTERGGKDLSTQFVRVRLYYQLPTELPITIPWTATPCPLTEATAGSYVDQVDLGVSLQAGSYNHKIPYRVVRPGIYRVSSTTMAKNREGALYYLDVPAVGLGPGGEMNISDDVELLITGASKLGGYLLEVDNKNLSYSTRERCDLLLPTSILPVGSTPGVDNEIRLAGQTLRLTYDYAPLIQELQDFFLAPLDRVLVANHLVRHFLPAYVFLDAAYQGGSKEGVVAADLIKLVNNISPDYNQLTSDAVVQVLKLRGASTVYLPLVLLALIHGNDRRIRTLRSKNRIGSNELVVFEGNYTQMYLIPGADTSGVTPRPTGEQTYLARY